MDLIRKNELIILADNDGFIIVYPDGIGLNWNDGRMDEEAIGRAHRENISNNLPSGTIQLQRKENRSYLWEVLTISQQPAIQSLH